MRLYRAIPESDSSFFWENMILIGIFLIVSVSILMARYS